MKNEKLKRFNIYRSSGTLNSQILWIKVKPEKVVSVILFEIFTVIFGIIRLLYIFLTNITCYWYSLLSTSVSRPKFLSILEHLSHTLINFRNYWVLFWSDIDAVCDIGSNYCLVHHLVRAAVRLHLHCYSLLYMLLFPFSCLLLLLLSPSFQDRSFVIFDSWWNLVKIMIRYGKLVVDFIKLYLVLILYLIYLLPVVVHQYLHLLFDSSNLSILLLQFKGKLLLYVSLDLLFVIIQITFFAILILLFDFDLYSHCTSTCTTMLILVNLIIELNPLSSQITRQRHHRVPHCVL